MVFNNIAFASSAESLASWAAFLASSASRLAFSVSVVAFSASLFAFASMFCWFWVSTLASSAHVSGLLRSLANYWYCSSGHHYQLAVVNNCFVLEWLKGFKISQGHKLYADMIHPVWTVWNSLCSLLLYWQSSNHFTVSNCLVSLKFSDSSERSKCFTFYCFYQKKLVL